jgi:4-hydroxy-3-polyprenylbenzoate decarboxylase
MDTLDYSSKGLNSGSKVVVAAAGKKYRSLQTEFSSPENLPVGLSKISLVAPGILAISCSAFVTYSKAKEEIEKWGIAMKEILSDAMHYFPLLLLTDNADFVAENYNNFLWTTFTRANPSHDIYGIDSFTEFKHWGCEGSLIIDTRIKPHHAPALILDDNVERRVDTIFANHPDLSKL